MFSLGRVAEIVPFFIITLHNIGLVWDKGMGQVKLSYAPKSMGQSILSHTVVPTEIYWYDYDSSNGTRYAPSPRARTAL